MKSISMFTQFSHQEILAANSNCFHQQTQLLLQYCNLLYSDTMYKFLIKLCIYGFSWSNNYMPLLNTKSFYLNLFRNLIANCKHMKKYQSQITQMFLLGNNKAKNPTIIYYVYIMDHEKISYKTLIQDLSGQYTIVLHCHTKIGINMHQFTASR